MPSPTPRRRPPRRTNRTRVALAVALAAAAGLAVWLRVSRHLPVLGTVPAFALVERSGTPLTSADLSGHVWIADFVFTRCPDVCPLLSQRMATLQRTLAQASDPVRLVSFSVDPAHDTPQVLGDYARHFGAGDQWLFVTGARDAILALLRDGFRVAFADDGPRESPITHSDRFVLVDRQTRIRGYYHGGDAADLERLVHDAGVLSGGEAVIPFTSLPALNATLNGASALLLAAGYLAIRRRRVHVHRACMAAAFATSVVFLASYLTYHLQAGTTRFPGQGWVRPLYFSLLGTHTVLAASIPPLAGVTLVLALRGRFTRHAQLARWTLPAWFYVSVTGVVIYFVLYHLYAPA